MYKQIDEVKAIETEHVIGTQIVLQDNKYNVMFCFGTKTNRYADLIEMGYSHFTGVFAYVDFNTRKEAQNYAYKIMRLASFDYYDYIKHKEGE